MAQQKMHPARKAFRSVLFVLLGLSMTFFVTIVALRITYHNAGIEGPLQAKIFEADIAQHHVRAFFGTDQDDVDIANELLRLGIFSPVYTRAGMRMLEDKAKQGFQPAIDQLAAIPDVYKSAAYKSWANDP